MNWPPKKELSMEMRLLLAFILMGAVLFLTPYLYKGTAPPPLKKSGPPAAAGPPPAGKTALPPPPKQESAEQRSAPPVTPVAAEKEDIFVLDTNRYRIEFVNRGAVVRSWSLKDYKRSGKPLELVNNAAAGKADLPFALAMKNQKPSVDLNQALYAAKPLANGLGITYEFSDGRVLSRKTFLFTKDSYLAHISTEVTANGTAIPHLIQWRGGFGDMAVTNAAGSQHIIHFDTATGKLVTTEAKAAKDGPVSSTGSYSFAGIEDTYFTAAFLPSGSVPLEVTTFSDSVPSPFEQKEQPYPGMAVGGEGRNDLALYVGPKDIDILRKVNPKLEQIVDFGWFAFLAKPLFLVVHWVSEHWVHNYGWAIVVVTVFINFLLFPLKLTSMKSMKKMQALQPQIAAINDKYKNIGMRDPRKAEQNQEVMELYKKHGVNPMGGCVPMMLQIPFFLAFYKVLSVSIEMRGASWLWVSDLSRPEDLAIRILPLAMIASQFVMQKMTPASGTDPNQQKIMLMMPLFLGFMFYGVQSGLVLYWLTGNLVGIAQQMFFNRTASAADAASSVQVKKKKK